MIMVRKQHPISHGITLSAQRSRRRHATRLGMTLIELLIGIVITGAAIAAGYATFATLVDQQQRAKVAVDEVSRGASIRRMLVGWIQSGRVQLSDGNVPRGSVSIGSRGVRDELRILVYGAPTPLGNYAFMTLYVNTDNPRQPPGLVAQFATPFNNAPDSMTISIDPNVSGMRVEYLTEQLNVRHWLTAEEIGQATVRPLAVRLFFVSNDPQRLTPLLHLPITVPLLSL